MELTMAIDVASSSTKRVPSFDRFEHYQLNTGPTHEFGDLPEAPPTIKNIGWTLGNDCPYRCTHCYSMNARVKGRDMTVTMVDRIVDQLRTNGVETVNLGGNEPLFTNGLDARKTLLPYIITSLVSAGIEVGLTTSGITLLQLYRDHRAAFDLLNDVDVSLDSPFEEEHNRNRGARLYHQAIEALELCRRHEKPHSVITCAMNWNFSLQHIDALVGVAKACEGNLRINPIKPIEPEHMSIALPADMYFRGFSRLMELCAPVDLGEPPLAAVTGFQHARRCPCGRTSFRIHSIAPDGAIYVSPCVYLHDFKVPLDLLERDLIDIIHSAQFRVFRQRNHNAGVVDGCSGCSLLPSCGGGCVARSYLHHLHESGNKTMLARDPYCPVRVERQYDFPHQPTLDIRERLVHMDYLCTWIGKPRL
jgi:radical SAM protein with 4Fe4S-binding SPASM domain